MSSNVNMTVVALNCRSIKNKLGEIKLLIYSQKPEVVAFTETWLTEDDDRYIPKFLGYMKEFKNRVGMHGGGVGILIKQGLNYQKLDVTPYIGGYLEYQAVRILTNNGDSVSICNMYNPGNSVTTQEIKHYISQLGNKFILIGDFNAHSRILDSNCMRANFTGRTLETLLAEEDLCLVNPQNMYTYVCPNNGKRSCLDLCLASPNIAALATIKTGADVGSDHVPIKVTIDKSPNINNIVFSKKWKINASNVMDFSHSLSKSKTELVKPCSIDEQVEEFTNRVISAATDNIKQTTGKCVFRQKRTIWWDRECSRMVAERRRARKQLERHPTQQNLLIYRAKSAEVCKLCKKKKKESFQRYIESVKYDTPKKEVWGKIRAVKNISYSCTMPIEVDNILITDPVEKANKYAYLLKEIAKPGKHTDLLDFGREYRQACSKGYDLAYNREISMDELQYAVEIAKSKSPGIDEITAVLLKNLPVNMMNELLSIINESFNTGYVPKSWKLGVIVPILKGGKSRRDIASYRPIALLSCVGKLMERIIQRRLEYIVTRGRLLQDCQMGFCKGESTMDVLLRIEHIIRKCLGVGNMCIVVYIDLKSAFDTVWSKGLMWKLIRGGVSGNMIRWLYEYFQNRTIKVRVEGQYSDTVSIGAGTPQGAILSPLLFNIMLGDMPEEDGVQKHIYADDITLTCYGRDTREVKKTIQNYLKKFLTWTERWGLQLNIGKTYMQYYTRKRMHYPIIRLKNEVIAYKKRHTILGMVFDSPLLTWKAHTEHLQVECLRRVQIMKAISSYSWGMSSNILKQFYIAYIRAKMDYGAILYESASISRLNKLESIQNACCRLILGVRKSSPILSIQVEAGLPPLSLHRMRLSIKALIKLRYKPENNSTVKLMNLESSRLLAIDHPVNSFTRRALSGCAIMNMCHIKRVCTNSIVDVPPWQKIMGTVNNIELGEIGSNMMFKEYVSTKYAKYRACYTDGSRVDSPKSSVACAAYFPHLKKHSVGSYIQISL